MPDATPAAALTRHDAALTRHDAALTRHDAAQALQ